MTTSETREQRNARVQRYLEEMVAAEGIPRAPMTKALANCRLGFVSTAGVYRLDQTPFDTDSPHGDWSYREIPKETPVAELGIAHTHYDHAHAERDINVVFPLERLREMEAEAVFAELASPLYSFMGYIPDPKPLVETTATEVAAKVRATRLDAVLLSPA